MKFLTLFLLSFLSFTSKAQSDYTIEYTIVSGVEMDDSNNATYTNKQYGTLFINSDTLSFFKFRRKEHPKKILLSDKESHHGTLRFIKTDSTYETSTLFPKTYLVNHNWNKILNKSWKILNDTLSILGYTCKKAVNDSGVVAWFTYSIPVNAGPRYYYGLPGVILQLNNYGRSKEIYTATSITIKVQLLFSQKNISLLLRKTIMICLKETGREGIL